LTFFIFTSCELLLASIFSVVTCSVCFYTSHLASYNGGFFLFMISEISSLNLDLGSLGIYLLIVMICPHKTVVFIWGKIFPQGVIL